MTSNKKSRIPSSRPPGSRSSSRRRMLTGGILAGSSLSLIPVRWARPVVQSVLLPVHAQTSACNDAVISGVTLTCTQTSALDEFQLCTFSVVDGCLTKDCETLARSTAPQDNQIGVLYYVDPGVEVEITVYTHTDLADCYLPNCSEGTVSCGDHWDLPGIQVDGQNFVASFTFGDTAGQVSISDIVLIPTG